LSRLEKVLIINYDGHEKVWQSMCMNSGTIPQPFGRGRYFKNNGMY